MLSLFVRGHLEGLEGCALALRAGRLVERAVDRREDRFLGDEGAEGHEVLRELTGACSRVDGELLHEVALDGGAHDIVGVNATRKLGFNVATTKGKQPNRLVRRNPFNLLARGYRRYARRFARSG